MKRDVVFLCQFFYPEYNSSATLPFDTAKYLAQCGYSVGALCGYPKEYSSIKNVPLQEKKCGVDIRRVRYIQLKRGRRLGRLINYFSFTLSMLFHITEFKKYKIIFVYSNPPILPVVALLAKKLYGCKIVFEVYDVYPEVAYASGSLKPNSLISKVMECINAQMSKKANAIITLTDEMKEFLLAHRKFLNRRKVFTIPNWATEKKVLDKHKKFEKFGYKGDEFIVSYFGNMGICQEMETLIQATKLLKDHPKIRFLYAGHGKKKEHVEDVLKENSNAKVKGFLQGEDFLEVLAISSVCVVTLEKGLKGTCAPSKYYSYLKAGKPVLAVVERDSYLRDEIEKNQIGYSVENGDVERLVQAIDFMYQHEKETVDMGKNAGVLYQTLYSKKNSCTKFERIISSQ